MKKTCIILIIACMLMMVSLVACTEKKPQATDPKTDLPVLQTDSPSGKTDAPVVHDASETLDQNQTEKMPENTEKETVPGNDAANTSEPVLETEEEDVSDEYVFDAGSNAGVGGN